MGGCEKQIVTDKLRNIFAKSRKIDQIQKTGILRTVVPPLINGQAI